jgi:Tol biopolymer transport system component
LMARTEQRVESPTWSPDGQRIAFTIFVGAVPRPYVMDADGDNIVRLLEEPGFALSWTPDGGRILISTASGFVSVKPDGRAERTFVADPPEDGRLVMDWSPDGRWIVLSSPSGVGDTLYFMPADGSQVFVIGVGVEPSWRPEPP